MRVPVLIPLSLTALLVPAGAGLGAPLPPGVPAVARPAALTVLLDRLDAARGAGPATGATGAVRAAGLLAGAPVDLAVPVPAGTPVRAAGVPAAAGRALGSLVAAADAAARLGATAVPADAGAFRRRAHAVAAGGFSDVAATRRLAGQVDSGQLRAAALLVATAVDDALPALRSATVGPASAAGAAVVCDLVDRPPVLCVSGTAADVHTGAYAVTVDLGGDDLYRGRAAVSDAGLPVSVLVDVAGSDDYLSTDVQAGVGAADTGGVAVLVDAAGNDSYRVRSTGGKAARGVGYALAGAAVLADLSGADRYDVSAGGPVAHARAEGLGYIGLGGLSVVADATGDDTYALRASPEPYTDEDGTLQLGSATVHGVASGVAGAALLADGGGRDTVLLDARTASTSPADPRRLGRTPSAAAIGIGYGSVGGVGAVLLGAGAATVTAQALADAATTGGASVRAGGWGGLAGYGAIDDAGGDDTYTATATSTAQRVAVVDDACRPADDEPWGCDTARSQVRAAAASVSALGHASLAAVGVLRDLGGKDHYTAEAVTTATATARDTRRQAPPGNLGAAAEASAGLAVVRAQGSGAVNPLALAGAAAGARLLEDGGAGALLDGAGADVYTAVARSSAHAAAESLTPGVVVEESATSGAADSESQAMSGGGGYAELRDTGGADSYSSTSTSTATTASGSGTASTGSVRSETQGSGAAPGDDSLLGQGTALLVDLDGGAADRFTSVPADPTATGARGTGAWQDAGSPSAGGFSG